MRSSENGNSATGGWRLVYNRNHFISRGKFFEFVEETCTDVGGKAKSVMVAYKGIRNNSEHDAAGFSEFVLRLCLLALPQISTSFSQKSNEKFGVAESEYELIFIEMLKQRFFATLRLYACANSYLRSATPKILVKLMDAQIFDMQSLPG